MTSSLASHVVHVYYGFCRDFNVDPLWTILSEEERNRAVRIRSKRDRRLYVTTRALLRRLLTAYLPLENKDINFHYGVNGKPSIASDDSLQFSAAHAGEVFLLGFTRNAAIGVDVEHLNRSIITQKLAGFLFSKNELLKFQRTDTALYSEHFINGWTRKEAVLKAKGVGFTFPPSQLEVSFLKSEPAEVVSTLWAPQEKSEWFLESLDIPEHYRGAVAVHGNIHSVTVRRMTGVSPHFTN